MLISQLIHAVWHFVTRLVQRRRDFSGVNDIAGTEPVRSAFSGLQLRRRIDAPRLDPPLNNFVQRWQPSLDYHRRQAEMQEMNRRLGKQAPPGQPLPPVFSFGDTLDMSPTRLQPRPNQQAYVGPPPETNGQQGDGAIRILDPSPATLPSEALPRSRPFLPRRYRRFLRSSPYLRVAAGVCLSVSVVLGFAWVTQLQRAEAVALSHIHGVRQAFHSELAYARSYGVDRKVVHHLRVLSRILDRREAAPQLVPGWARLHFYRAQEHQYRALLRAARYDEQRARRYWTRQENITYAALVRVTRTARRLGLPVALPTRRVCTTPRCYRVAVRKQKRREAWLRRASDSLHAYATTLSRAVDPVAAAGAKIQEATALNSLLPDSVKVFVPVATLDGMYATAGGPAVDVRVGALAQLDIDRLQAVLARRLPRQAIVVSLEEQKVACYQAGKVVYRSLLTAGSTVPDGTFHIQAKQVSVPATYWGQSGSFYRFGTLPDWMAFDHGTLQGAPWRSVFGPGSATVPPLYAPSTPGSVDLPPAAAAFLYKWAPVGTAVVVY